MITVKRSSLCIGWGTWRESTLNYTENKYDITLKGNIPLFFSITAFKHFSIMLYLSRK